MNGLQLTLDRNQRWLFDKSKYRLLPPEAIRPADYEIPKSWMTDSTGFIRALQYSGLTGAARVRVGLYRHGELVGVAVFSHPCSDAVLTRTLPEISRRGGYMRFWFVFAAMMGPKFFRCFVVLFVIGMALMLYSLVRS